MNGVSVPAGDYGDANIVDTSILIVYSIGPSNVSP